MGFRTVVVKGRGKIETRLNWLIIRTEQEKWILLDEIGTLVLETTQSAITTQALMQLTKSNVNIVFCDEKHLPLSSVVPYYANYQTSLSVKKQSQWSDDIKNLVWQQIIKDKILWQSKVLQYNEKVNECKMLREYIEQVELGDTTNREGHSAKVYFNALFGMDFDRRLDGEINAALNYGYAILLSSVAREIVVAGFITQIGIHHINQFNHYNLASDLMETFRPILDLHILSLEQGANIKLHAKKILTAKIKIQDKEYYFDDCLRLYVRGVLSVLCGDSKKMPHIQSFLLGDESEL
ncbi:MAG: type II CRISPR-associated endonuclease Cas1 [Clostridiales bacterium]|jgi:CRISPR-associated endonuclease Cas1 subtype II|nr:type II CRISPR-associated endonuclease Cas1 [Clostridiales bacterium]